MKLTFLGTGSAFTVGCDNYHSNMLLEDDKQQRLLIDCGSDVRHSLYDLGMTSKDIQATYISHLHADHAGGLEWLAFSTKFDTKCQKPLLYTSELIVSDLWNKVLAGGLSSLQEIEADLSTYFQVMPIDETGLFHWNDMTFQAIKTIHIISGHTIMPSFGLLFTYKNITVFITTDCQFRPDQLMPYYQKADIIFHDCETASSKSGVHPNYSDLVTLDTTLKNKMWLYHYNPGTLPNAVQDGFRGFVKKGQCFDFNNPQTLR